MLEKIILYYFIVYYIILYYVMLCYAMLYYIYIFNISPDMSELSRRIIYIILYYMIHEHFNLVRYECQRNAHLAVIRYK